MESSVAVATSATCVIFTSSSTTFQYFYMQRIIVPYAIVYAGVSSVASVFGKQLIEYIIKRYHARGDALITLLVAFAVALSALLAIMKGLKEEL